MPPKGKQGPGRKAPGKSHPDNHGAEVSEIARQTPRGKSGQHGQIVSTAAHATTDVAANPSLPSDELEGN